MGRPRQMGFLLAGIGGLAMVPPAYAIPFSITGAAFAPGSGYGQDAGNNGENGGKLLDVRFTNTFLPESFDLGVGGSYTFDVGTVNLLEPDSGNGANFGIRNQELDGLGVNIFFTFTDPLGAVQNILATGTGTATQGGIADGAVDYVLDWAAVPVSFGSGGLFVIDLADLMFSDRGLQTQTATITLHDLPQVAEITFIPDAGPAIRDTVSVPEPASMSLLGLGLLGLVVARRKKPA